MKALEFLQTLSNHAKEYAPLCAESIHRNKHMNRIQPHQHPREEEIDAILVDFINFIASKNGIDYALYTGDLHTGTELTDKQG